MDNVAYITKGMSVEQRQAFFENRVNRIINNDDTDTYTSTTGRLTELETYLCKKETSYKQPKNTQMILFISSFVLSIISQKKNPDIVDLDKFYNETFGEFAYLQGLINHYTIKHKLRNKGFSIKCDDKGNITHLTLIYDLNEKHDLAFSIKENIGKKRG